MTLHTPISMQPTVGDATYPSGIPYTAQEFRQMMRSLLNCTASPGAEGCVTSADFAVTQRAAGATFSVDVSAGFAWVNGNDVSNQGPYFVWNDGVVNVATPSAPGSGTRIHRLVLQIEDKLANGTWTGYTANPLVLQDVGSGTPAEPNSATTLALISIAAGQASVLNANIADSRIILANPYVYKAADQSRTSTTTLASDSSLTLPVSASTAYSFDCQVAFTSASATDFKWSWASPAGAVMLYQAMHNEGGTTGLNSSALIYGAATVGFATGPGLVNPQGIWMHGSLRTSSAGWLTLQWAQNTSGAGATTVKSGSYLSLARVSA